MILYLQAVQPGSGPALLLASLANSILRVSGASLADLAVLLLRALDRKRPEKTVAGSHWKCERAGARIGLCRFLLRLRPGDHLLGSLQLDGLRARARAGRGAVFVPCAT